MTNMSKDFRKNISRKKYDIKCNRRGRYVIQEDDVKRQNIRKNSIGKFREKGYLVVDNRQIIRFLQRNLYRNWDDIYSEVCEQNKGYIGNEIKEELKYLVKLGCTSKDGEVFNSRGEKLYSWFRREFYVDQTGLLKSLEPEPKFVRKKRSKKIFNIQGQDYFFFKGIWYRVKVNRLPEPFIKHEVVRIGKYTIYTDVKIYSGYSDVFGLVFDSTYQAEHQAMDSYNNLVYCSYKEQASSKECKILNRLRNAEATKTQKAS